jgi:hypothetical protein
MSDSCTFASAPHRRPLHRRHGLMAMRSVITSLFRRIRLRQELRRRMKVSFPVIDDICLARQRAAENVGAFWHL